MNDAHDGQELTSAIRYTEQERRRYAGMLEEQRKALGLTQSDVAERSGVTRKTIGNIESGKTIPQSDILHRVMTALDMHGDSFSRYSESTRGWLASIAPLIEALPEPPLTTVMRGIQANLVAAAQSMTRQSDTQGVTALYALAASEANYDDEAEAAMETP